MSAEKVGQGVFNLEIISNGKANAVNNADITFPINEMIETIRVKNGQQVSKGQVLAVLDNAELKRKVERSRQGVDKARVDPCEHVIDSVYFLNDNTLVAKRKIF